MTKETKPIETPIPVKMVTLESIAEADRIGSVEAARILGTTIATLCRWRRMDVGPRWSWAKGCSVYSRAELEAIRERNAAALGHTVGEEVPA